MLFSLKAHMNVRRLMSDNKAVRRRNKGPHGNRVANGQTGPANGGAMVSRTDWETVEFDRNRFLPEYSAEYLTEYSAETE